MKYTKVNQYIESKQNLGIVLGLESMIRLCAKIGNPQQKLKYIHIVGTNGKGSVARYITQILKVAGYKVGTYSTPVVFDYCEMIQINGKKIPQKDMGNYMEVIKEACDLIVLEGYNHPTPFEIETALVFLYFYEKECDIVVLEAGMGGLLDATNCIDAPLVSVFTAISKDHMNFLGNTIEEIAYQKAGIIKAGTLVVSAPQITSVIDILQETCKKENCTLSIATNDAASGVKYSLQGTKFIYENDYKIELPLLGKHQLQNCLVALQVIEQLKDNYTQFERIEKTHIIKGIKSVQWPARLEKIADKPLFYLDGAHNEDGAKRLAESLALYFKNKKIICIMGILKDKQCEQMLEHLTPYMEHIVTVKPPNNQRAMEGIELAHIVQQYFPHVTAVDSIEEAVEISYLLATKNDVILACGSLSYMKQCMQCVKKRNIGGQHG